jgi:hypothetical protein
MPVVYHGYPRVKDVTLAPRPFQEPGESEASGRVGSNSSIGLPARQRITGAPSLGLPTEPQLTHTTPPYFRTHGLCVAEDKDRIVRGCSKAFVQTCRLVLEQVLVDFSWGP